MRNYFQVLSQLFAVLANARRDPKVQILLVLGLGLLMTGMVVYHFVEGWPWLDSLYFSTVTLATVGYGDLHPTTTLGKLFTIAYIFLGVGVFVGIFAFISRAGASLHDVRSPPPPRDPPAGP